MRNKLIFSILIIVFTFSLVLAQVPDALDDPVVRVDGDGNEISGGLIQEREGQDRLFSWENIYEQLLKNENVAVVDNIFRNNDLIFRVFFGVPYEFSGTMLLIFILWFFTLMFLPDLVASIDFFNKITSWIAALLIVVILAQAQFFRIIVNISERFYFNFENQWMRFIVFFVIIIMYAGYYYVGRALTNYLNKMKDDREEKDLKENTIAIDKERLRGQKEGEDFSKKMIDGMSSAGKKK